MTFDINLYIDQILNNKLGDTGKKQHIISELYYQIFRTSPIAYNEMYHKDKLRGWRQFNRRKIMVPPEDNWDQLYENLFSAIENEAKDALTDLTGMADVLTGAANGSSIQQKVNHGDYKKIKIKMALYIASLWYRQEHIKGNKVDYVPLDEFKEIIKTIAISLEKIDNWTVAYTTFVQLPFSDNPVITYDIKISEMNSEWKNLRGFSESDDKKYWSSLIDSQAIYIPLNKYNLLIISRQSLIEVFENENKILDMGIESKKYLISLGKSGISSLTKENFPVQILRMSSSFVDSGQRWIKAITPIFVFNEYIDMVNRKASYMATPQEKRPDNASSFRSVLNAKTHCLNSSAIQAMFKKDYQAILEVIEAKSNFTNTTQLSEKALTILRPYFNESYSNYKSSLIKTNFVKDM